MNRRRLITLLGGASVAWPLAARAQQPAMPVIGFLNSGSLDTGREVVAWVRRGLSDTGHNESRNLVIEFRWAEDRLDQLPGFAADLVRRQVAVIVAISLPAALAAKTATKSIPIVFAIGANPVEAGLVTSLNRPGGNLTGVSYLSTEVAAKRLELLRELVPAATEIAFLVNPADPAIAESETRELQVAARILGVQLLVLNASSVGDLEAAFASLVQRRAGGLVVCSQALFLNHPDQLVALADRHRVPATYPWREAPAGGGLMSYGTDRPDAWRQVGNYSGRILMGEKPADLPVQQVTKMQLVINLKTAKALGITVPITLLVRADEVIE